MRRAFPLGILIALLASPVCAADLTKIERAIHKEPAYQSKTPRYCLLVFGPEATTRVWLALDGKTLYVDRNGNGDLTDEGESIVASKGHPNFGEDGEMLFLIGDIRDGPRTHKKLSLRVRNMDYLAERSAGVKAWLLKTPQARGIFLNAEVEMPGWKGNGSGGRVDQFVSLRDHHGFLTFAAKPADAPILHFGGSWQAVYANPERLLLGSESEVIVNVGTPGLGAGTFVSIAYEGIIPENRHPRLEITYPTRQPGEPPLKQHYELKERC